MLYPKRDLIEVLKNLNDEYKLNKRFEKNEISAAMYCNTAHAISKVRALNMAGLILTGSACIIAGTLSQIPQFDSIRENALITASIIISTAAAINFAAKNFKNIYFETYRDKEYFKSRIINESISNLNKNDSELMGNSFNSDDLHNALIWGNELNSIKTSSIFEKTKEIVSKIQEGWSKSTFNFWKVNRSEIESDIRTNINKKNNIIKKIINELNDPESIDNKKIEIIQKKLNKSVTPEKIMEEIKEKNKIAINKAIELYNNQALEIIFLKVVSDFSKGIVHHNLLNMFKDLESQHTYNDSNHGRTVENSFVVMSNYAVKMIGGIDILKSNNLSLPNLTLENIASRINPDLVANNKIKFVSFNNFLMNQKDAAIKNYIRVKKPDNNQIDINKLDIDLLISIKKEYEKSPEERKKINDLDNKMKINEIFSKNKKNRNIVS